MSATETKPTKTMKILRWIARIWSLVIILFFLIFLIGEIVYPDTEGSIETIDIILMFVFFGGTNLGLILAWRWEGLGGAVSLASILAFITVLGVQGRINDLNFFSLLAFIAVPGILFLILSFLTRRVQKSAMAE